MSEMADWAKEWDFRIGYIMAQLEGHIPRPAKEWLLKSILETQEVIRAEGYAAGYAKAREQAVAECQLVGKEVGPKYRADETELAEMERCSKVLAASVCADRVRALTDEPISQEHLIRDAGRERLP